MRMVYLLAAAMVLALLLATYAVWTSSNRASQNGTALKALCYQRDDLDRQIHGTKAVLEVTHGDVFGIPRALILSNLHSREMFRHNLSILDCGGHR